jgi:hypothetical protein
VPDALAERGWSIERHDDHFPQDATDELILRAIADRGWVFLTQDRKIRTRGPERRILLDHGVRTISVSATANLSAAETVAALVAAESAIFAAVGAAEPPYVFTVSRSGRLSRLNLDG